MDRARSLSKRAHKFIRSDTESHFIGGRFSIIGGMQYLIIVQNKWTCTITKFAQ